MKKLSALFMGLIVVCMLLSSGIPEKQAFAAETLKFKIAFPGSPNSYNVRAHLWWAKEVERRTNGKVKMEPYFGGALGNHGEMVKLVGSGAVDIGDSVWAPYNPQLFPLHSVTDGPVIWSKNPVALVYAGMQLEKEIPEVAV